MSKFILNCEALFDSKDLYTVLGITNKNVKDSELKKAYYKISLQVHPDKVNDDEKSEATEKFKVLSKVYTILSDKEKRAVYDETGEIDDENLDPGKNWNEYWRILFKKITITDIKNFEQEYRGSEEELKDLKQAYIDGEGNMDYILENVLCATFDDEDRFTDILKDFIKRKHIEAFPNFTKRTKKQKDSRKRKAAKEEVEANELKMELGLGDTDDSLRQMILNRGKSRQQEMDGFLDSLTQKYGGGSKKVKGKSKK